MESILQLHTITKDFDGLRAVDRVSFEVAPGQIVGLIGPNGSGKSTLLNTIAGAYPPTDGRITFAGEPIERLRADAIFARGLVRGYQDPALFFGLTALDNLMLPARKQRGERPWFAPLRRLWRDEERAHAGRAAEALARFGLGHAGEQPAADLSGGQMKLLDLARGAVSDARLLLLDEPTAGVAPVLARRIFDEIARLRAECGMSFLIVEHRLDILFDYADQVVVMHMGAVIARGTPAQVTADARVREVYLGD